MIELNINLKTIVEVEFNIKGNKTKPILRTLLRTSNYFVGFEGTDSKISIPPLNFVQWESDLIDLEIEVLTDEYRIELWKGVIKLNNTEDVFESTNKIKIKVGLIEEAEIKPTVKITPKFL